MKLFLSLLVALTLLGCNSTTPDQPDTTDATAPTAIDARDPGADIVDPKSIARLGDACGPESEKLCASGLSCQFEGTNQTAGICLPVIVNPDLECDTNNSPVCGLIGNNKNGYQNECFARRYGAVVVAEGFCKTDPAVKNNCDARTYSIGNCQESFNGAFFNAQTGKCEAVTMTGCGADIPFGSVEACASACS